MRIHSLVVWTLRRSTIGARSRLCSRRRSSGDGASYKNGATSLKCHYLILTLKSRTGRRACPWPSGRGIQHDDDRERPTFDSWGTDDI